MNNGLVWVVLAAFLGALGSGMAGWWDSNEPFCLRKFMGTVWRAIFAAMAFALVFESTQFTGLYVYIAAFLGGAGVDVLGNRLQGGVVAREPLANKVNQLQNEIQKSADKRTSSGQKGEPTT